MNAAKQVPPPPPLPPSLDEVRRAVQAACEGRPVARVEIFGSAARGDPRPDSDVDFLVEFVPGAAAGLLEMGDLQEDLEERIGRRVDLLSRPAVERSRNEARRRAILSAPVTIYER